MLTHHLFSGSKPLQVAGTGSTKKNQSIDFDDFTTFVPSSSNPFAPSDSAFAPSNGPASSKTIFRSSPHRNRSSPHRSKKPPTPLKRRVNNTENIQPEANNVDQSKSNSVVHFHQLKRRLDQQFDESKPLEISKFGVPSPLAKKLFLSLSQEGEFSPSSLA
eukprot:TRINITY_DN8862_c0_g1_i1.p1 TRINITY_DN8862_c0_g1~~TRINITY_DN8862_c0_g1_i1.p1  ORF type:complete len:161 (+),score=33.31 TRINITY_DN8862_c0_g1_i1:374-856(+)